MQIEMKLSYRLQTRKIKDENSRTLKMLHPHYKTQIDFL